MAGDVVDIGILCLGFSRKQSATRMGNCVSEASITEQDLQAYCSLLYLTKGEIFEIFRRFRKIDPSTIESDRDGARFDIDRIGQDFPEIKHNPFKDRILEVFSSRRDKKMSFEDVLDFFSALNRKCPDDVKAAWAFQIFDYDGDGHLNRDDIAKLLNQLLPKSTDSDKERLTSALTQEETLDIADKILVDLDLDKTGGITSNEFVHAVVKMPDFFNSFRIKV